MGGVNGKKLVRVGQGDVALLWPSLGADGLSPDVLSLGGTGQEPALVPAAPARLALTPDSWKAGVTGSWATAADWSTGAAPNSSNDVTISVAGTYNVNVAAAAASNSVTLNNATAKINDTSTLTVSTNLAVTAGQFIVNNTGTLVGGTISIGASGKFLVLSGATLSGITYQGTLTPQANATVYIENGITLTGAGGTGSGTISLAGGGEALNILDNETLNNATLSFGSGTNDYLYLNEASSTSTQSLTLGSGFVISQTGGTNIVGPYNYNGGSITDAGLISISGGTLFVGNGLGTFNDSGSIAISGGVFDLQTTMVAAGTISTSGAGTFLLDSDAIVSGTVSAAGIALKSNGGTLDALTWKGPLSLLASQTAYVEGGLSVTGTGGTGNGTINLSAGSVSLYVLDNETLNNETLSFGSGSNNYFGLYEPSSVTSQTLTLGTGFSITQSGGTNYFDGYSGYDNGLLINQGAITVSGGDLVDDQYSGGFTNAGKIAVSGGTFTAQNAGTFANTGSIVVGGGVFDLETAMNGAGAVTTSGSGVFDIGDSAVLSGTIAASGVEFAFKGGTLSAATWQGPLTLGVNQTAYVQGGLSVTGAGGTGNGTIHLSAGGDSLYVLDNETLNNAMLSFGSGSNNYFGLYEPSSTVTQTLTLGDSFSITETGGTNYLDGDNDYYNGLLVNEGAIMVSGGDLIDDQYIGGFTNSGTIAVSAGTFTAGNAGTFVNSGSINVSGGTFTAGSGAFTNSGSILVSGGAFDLETALASVANITTSGSGVFEVGSAGTLSGTINAAGTGFAFQGGTLSAATWEGPLTFGSGQTLYVEGGLAVTGAGGTGNGTIHLSAGGDSLYVLDNETLNNETLSFGSSNNNYFGLYEPSSTVTQTLTLGDSFSITETGGTNYLDGDNDYYNGLLINQGAIMVSGGDLIDDQYIGGFTNSGTIAVSAGTFTAQNASTFVNTGTIAISGGSFSASNAATFTNAGSIVISGGTFDLETTMASLGKISTSGSGVFDLGSNGILGGTITAAETNFSFQDGTLSAATWQGPLTLGANQGLNIQGGLTVTGASGTGNGVISLAAGGDSLWVIDSETLNNETLSFGSGNGNYFYLWNPSSTITQTVTLGSGLTLQQTGGTNYIQPGNYADVVLLNAGLISVTGGSLGVTLAGFANSGNIAISGGGTLDLSGVTKFSSLVAGTLSGNYSLSAASILELANNAAVTTLAGTVALTGAGSSIQSYNTTTGAQITLDGKLATVAATGALDIGAGRSFSAANAFVDNGLVTLAGGAFTEKSVTIANGAVFSGSGSITGTLVDNGVITASGGLLKLANALTGNGALQIDTGATLEAAAATTAQETVTFEGSGATLKIDTPTSFASVLAGFAPGDVIDLSKTAVTSVSSTGTTIAAVTAGGTISLALAAALTNEHLYLTSDGNGGTDIVAYGYAQSSAHAPEPVAFGNHHVGDAVSTALTLSNIAPNTGFYENLDASIGGAAGAITASGSFTGLASQLSNSSSLVVGLDTGAEGSVTGQAVLSLFSDGAGVDGFGQTSLGTQLVNVTGAVYGYAQASLANNGTVTLASTHVGQAVSGTLVVTNSAAAGGYSEALDVSITPSSPFSGVGSLSAVAAGSSGTLSVGYSGGGAGAYSGTETLGLVSDGTAIGDGLGTTTLTSQTVTVIGATYAYASGTLASSSVSLAIVHVGQSDSAALTLTNGAASGMYSEALDAGLSGATAGVTTSGTLSGLAAGAVDMSSLLVGLNISTSGSFSGTALLNLVSDGNAIGDGLGTTSLGSQTVTVNGIVDNYALAAFQDPGGPAISGSSTQYAVSLGNVVQGSASEVLSLGVLNAATGLSDLLQGTISSSGASGFTNTGFGAFSGLGAGQGEHSQSVTLSTSTAGTFTETILLSSAGTNASGYDGALATETLTVTGVITPVGSTTYTLSAGPNTITGANGGDLFVAPTYSLNSRDSLTGGTGANVMQLSGGGQFDLGAPKVFANIPTVTAYEGQTASGAVASTQQVVFLRDGSNETVNVVAGTAAKGDTNPESIIIYSSAATNTINLASGSDQVFLATGNDTVVLGGAKNSVVAGGGIALVQSLAANASASIVGTTTGSTVLQITNAGTVTLNAADTDLTVQLGGTTKLTLDKLQFITANGGNGGDTIIAGAANQTLIGGAADVLTGYSGGGDLFSGATAALNGDTIGNWATGDSIDLTDMSASATLSYAGNTKSGKLTVSSGSLKAVISFTGDYTLSNFAKPVTDGHGGALITYIA